MGRAVLLLAWLAAVGAASAGCAAAENAAAKDPMRCERDPSCSRARGSYVDCTRQCVDDQECERLCEEMQSQTGRVGHP